MNEKCPNCGSKYIYFNGTLCVCIHCQYEWIGKIPENMQEKDIWQSIKDNDKNNKLAGY